MNDRVRVGAKAPDFTLPSQSKETVRLGDFLGKPVVLFFYPKDDTPGCTKEVCAFRDNFEQYGKLDCELIGVSSDSVESHQKFAEHHDLPLRLLSDSTQEVANSYGARSLIPGKVARSVFVIDANGIIRYRDVRPLGLFRPKDDEVIKAINAARV